MHAAHESLDCLSFPTASGVVARSFCKISGDIATEKCAEKATGYYKTNDIPSKCKNCAIRNGIGQGIPDVIPNTATTTEISTTAPIISTTKPITTIAPPTTTPPTTSAPSTEASTAVATPSESVQAQVAAAINNTF